MNGFYISIKNDLLEKKHHDAMGSAVWLYMWLLDKMTSVDESGIGKVLGGKPITHEDFKDNLDISRHSYVRYVKKLEEGGYIGTKRTPRGLIFEVYKASKIYANKSKNQKSDVPKSRSDVPFSRSDVPKSNIQYKTIQRQYNDKKENKLKHLKTAKEMPDLSNGFYEQFDRRLKTTNT